MNCLPRYLFHWFSIPLAQSCESMTCFCAGMFSVYLAEGWSSAWNYKELISQNIKEYINRKDNPAPTAYNPIFLNSLSHTGVVILSHSIPYMDFFLSTKFTFPPKSSLFKCYFIILGGIQGLLIGVMHCFNLKKLLLFLITCCNCDL